MFGIDSETIQQISNFLLSNRKLYVVFLALSVYKFSNTLIHSQFLFCLLIIVTYLTYDRFYDVVPMTHDDFFVACVSFKKTSLKSTVFPLTPQSMASGDICFVLLCLCNEDTCERKL